MKINIGYLFLLSVFQQQLHIPSASDYSRSAIAHIYMKNLVLQSYLHLKILPFGRKYDARTRSTNYLKCWAIVVTNTTLSWSSWLLAFFYGHSKLKWPFFLQDQHSMFFRSFCTHFVLFLLLKHILLRSISLFFQTAVQISFQLLPKENGKINHR